MDWKSHWKENENCNDRIVKNDNLQMMWLASNNTYIHLHRSRDSAVGIATGYGLDDLESEFESR
jgi:hypothetical protein